MATDEERALLEAIWARPADSAPRLVYADWLMERQDPRGEFIRLQCDAAALQGGPLRGELEHRASALLHQHRHAWSPGGIEWRFVRGFPSAAKLAAPDLLEKLGFLETVPSFEGLDLNFNGVTEALGEVWSRVFSEPLFDRVRSLRLTWHVPQSVVHSLLARPWLSRLESLQLSWVSLREPAWKLMGETATLRTLRKLDLGLSGATDSAVEALASLPWPRLTSLSLANNQLGTRSCGWLARPGAWPALEELDVSWNRIGKKGGQQLAGAEWMANLRTLDLSHDQVGDETCVALAAAKPPKLRWLGLEASRVTEGGKAVLAKGLPGVVVKYR